MGHMIYGVAPAIRIDDWGLSHLQAVIITKIRRNESFSFSWDDEPEVDGDDSSPDPGHHGAVWISKSSSLYFSYDGPRSRALNREWLEELSQAASSTGGLRLLPEPTPSGPSAAS
ncbi:hypothetical protein [Microbacterium flavum]|uniref:DUF7882 domain-containing protein n=1 Tax=Microbacterium flavum TaxID=415216 RepID=A0ABS5XRT6_9MICO|nr:hypothetical protein [Microbacterium flavum]MBT8797246.1 hypothetical protein [Microbacterium flavum]